MKTIDTIVENLFYVIPIIHKKLMKVDPPDVNIGMHLSRLHMGVLVILHENTVPISEIAKNLLIPKPQMTYLINQMVNAGLVERQPNMQDRRIVDIALTEKGREIFQLCDEFLKDNVKEKLAYLSEKELEDFSLTLMKLKEIGSKLEDSVKS